MAFGGVLFITEDFHVSPDEAVDDAFACPMFESLLVLFVRIFLRIYFLSVSDFLDVYFSLFFIYFKYDS